MSSVTHSLVESVARAICESKPDRAGFWETTPEPRRKGYRTQARAATVAVLKEGVKNFTETGDIHVALELVDWLAQIEGEQ
jgi:hypothetical protein